MITNKELEWLKWAVELEGDLDVTAGSRFWNMKANEYQELALRTAPSIPGENQDLVYASLGLTGEAGEFSEVMKKVAYHGHPIDKTRLIKELGDVQWYVAYAAKCLGVSLQEVMQMNIDKLKARYPEGFSVEKSVNRKPGDL